MPNVLALIGANHGHNELYHSIISTSPDLMSLIDRRDMLKAAMAKNKVSMANKTLQIAALTADITALNEANSRMENQLLSVGRSDQIRPFADGQLSGKKRGFDT